MIPTKPHGSLQLINLLIIYNAYDGTKMSVEDFRAALCKSLAEIQDNDHPHVKFVKNKINKLI